MTKVEQLAATASTLSGDQLDGLLAFGRQLNSAPYYDRAPPAAIASIDRGLSDLGDGKTIPSGDVFSALQRKIDSARSA